MNIMNTVGKTQGTARMVGRELRLIAHKERVPVYTSFFKTGKGEYGEGDKFIGVTVPAQRIIAKKYSALSLDEIDALLKSPIHEERLTALIILVGKYKKGDSHTQKKIYDFYCAHTGNINNWDLVDSSAQYIVGEYLVERERNILYKFTRSKNLWERRIAIIATWAFIRRGDFSDTFAIATVLLTDKHDLIHKAVGWMLREVGKRDSVQLEGFLMKNIHVMPRTTLRYAIERFPVQKRKQYLGIK